LYLFSLGSPSSCLLSSRSSCIMCLQQKTPQITRRKSMITCLLFCILTSIVLPLCLRR
jgi:hypothetical protein